MNVLIKTRIANNEHISVYMQLDMFFYMIIS
jgi:hypothetical protein